MVATCNLDIQLFLVGKNGPILRPKGQSVALGEVTLIMFYWGPRFGDLVGFRIPRELFQSQFPSRLLVRKRLIILSPRITLAFTSSKNQASTTNPQQEGCVNTSMYKNTPIRCVCFRLGMHNIIQRSDHVGQGQDYVMSGAKVVSYGCLSVRIFSLKKGVRFGQSTVIEYY